MRTAIVRPAVFICFAAACSGGGGSGPTPGAAPAPASISAAKAAAPDTATSASMSDATWRTEEARYHELAERLRGKLLEASTFVQFDTENCAPGALRTFADTSKSGRQEVELTMDRLERLVVARGINGSIDAPEAHDLLILAMQWEAAATRPRWDVPAGDSAPMALSTGLSGEYRNPISGKCENYLPFDTITFVIPTVTHFTPPVLPGVRATIYFGEEGLKAARDAFFVTVGRLRDDSFVYTRVREVVVWQDYAVLVVNRPAEQRGVVQGTRGAGGASYIFHRVKGEWRLLAITRTWT